MRGVFISLNYYIIMSPIFASTTSSDVDKAREQFLVELGDIRYRNTVLKVYGG